jgi:hypothetical protein
MCAEFLVADAMAPVQEVTRLDEEIVEISLLLPGWQADELASVAQDRGLTAGQLLRRVLRDFCRQQHRREPEPWTAPAADAWA